MIKLLMSHPCDMRESPSPPFTYLLYFVYVDVEFVFLCFHKVCLKIDEVDDDIIITFDKGILDSIITTFFIIALHNLYLAG